MRGKAASVLAGKMGSLRQPSLGLPKSKNRRFTSLVATALIRFVWTALSH